MRSSSKISAAGIVTHADRRRLVGMAETTFITLQNCYRLTEQGQRLAAP